MAEFLVKAVDANHPDPVKDARGCYKRGDVVVVMPDGHEWGKLEGPPKFVIVKVPGMDVEKACEYLRPVQEQINARQPEKERQVQCRRRFKIDLDAMDAVEALQITKDGKMVVVESRGKQLLRDKSTKETVDAKETEVKNNGRRR